MTLERVEIRFRGLMLEAFLSRALKEGALFERVTRIGAREALLVTDERGAAAVLKLAETYHIDAMIETRRGAGAWRKRLRERWTYPASFAIAAVLVMLFLSRIWWIDVELLDPGMRADVLHRAVRDAGAVAGMRASALDEGELARAIHARVPEYTFVDARRQGARLLVAAAIEDDAPEIYDPTAARDLVAARDGIVETVEVHTGTATVKPGDVVRRGQVLIAGEERDTRETARGVAALGVVTARFWTQSTVETPLEIPVIERTGRAHSAERLECPGYSFVLSECEPFAHEDVETECLPVGGIVFPVCIVRETHYETRARTETLDADATRDRLYLIAEENARKMAPDNVSAVDKWTDYSMIEQKRIRVRVALEFVDDIAATRAEIRD